jgi:hypothetical protein
MNDPYRNADYLGDAVYAIFDGYGIWLTTDSHRREEAGNQIYLEPAVIDALDRFRDRMKTRFEK